MNGTWHVHVRPLNKKPAAEQQRQQHKAALLEACREGKHSNLPTFRPSETICQGCGVVFYCPGCLKQHHLPLPVSKHARVRRCPQHVEVSTCQN